MLGHGGGVMLGADSNVAALAVQDHQEFPMRMRQQFRKRRHACDSVALKTRRLKFYGRHMRLNRIKKCFSPQLKCLRRLVLLTRGRQPLKHRVHANAHRGAAKFDPRIEKIRGVIVFDHAPIIEERQIIYHARP